MHSFLSAPNRPYCRLLIVLTVFALAPVATVYARVKVIQKSMPPYSTPIVESHNENTILPRRSLSKATQSILRQKKLHFSYRSQPDETIRALHSAIGSGESLKVRSAAIETCLQVGTRQSSAGQAAGYFITAAELAFEGLSDGQGSRADKAHLLALYNESCGVAAEALASIGDPFDSGSVSGPIKSYQIRQRTSGEELLDIRTFDQLVPASNLEFRNIDVERLITRGVGAAMVAHYARTDERHRANPFLGQQGLMLPVNVCFEFTESGKAVLSCRDLHLVTEASIGGSTRTLSGDLSAPVAVLLSNVPAMNVAWEGLVHPDRYEDNMGLFQLEPHRPNQIPVVFVHGLVSSPAIWFEALNQLREDPVLREKYQVLAFYYPTGFPIAYNAHSLRSRLKEYRETYDPHDSNAYMHKMVMIGHSMGGQLTNAQIRTSGDTFTKLIFTRPIDELDGLSESQKKTFKDLLLYKPNPDISRVIFLASPHRGSELATGGIGKLGHKLINIPQRALSYVPDPEIEGLTPLGKEIVLSRPDSIEALSPNSPGLMAILEQPIRDGVTIHSIIGNHKMAPSLEDSSDTVVPYWSSHLDYAVSEVVVDAKHIPICKNEEAINEVRRILYLHAGLKSE
tara:strand:- start:2428 stop:4302 length:1875 start_codon:yes stop_codon:yes gene_type:complete